MCAADRLRALYVSSAIGLGHVSKDLAIVAELRSLRPDAEVLWLAGPPATDAIADAGERVLPEAQEWLGASAIAERTYRGGQLELLDFVYRSLPSWAHNARIVKRVAEAHDVDVVIGDEAWEISIPITLGMLHLAAPFVLITDFVGTDAMTPGLVQRLKSYILNVVWSRDAKVFPRGGHRVIFIGDIEDIPDSPFGWRLPNRREHARTNYAPVGHVVRFDPEEYRDRRAWRARLGYGERPLVICSAGGTSIGKQLLELCAEAFPLVRESMPDLQMVIVCGPRLSLDSSRLPSGIDVRGYVPRLYEHHACCDVAVTQCGASTTTELLAFGTPFVYFPIEGHFEQELVAARLARHEAGMRMSLRDATPRALADAIAHEYRRQYAYQDIDFDGASRAALHIAETVDRSRGVSV